MAYAALEVIHTSLLYMGVKRQHRPLNDSSDYYTPNILVVIYITEFLINRV